MLDYDRSIRSPFKQSFVFRAIPHRCRNDRSSIDSRSSLSSPRSASHDRTCSSLYETEVRDSSVPTCVGSWQRLPGLCRPRNRRYASAYVARTPGLAASPSRSPDPSGSLASCSRAWVQTTGRLPSSRSSLDPDSTSHPVRSWLNKRDSFS